METRERELKSGGGSELGRDVFRELFWRNLGANVVAATVAFVYLSFVAPPQPEPPHSERFLFLGVVPVFVVVAAIIGHRIATRAFAPVRQ